MPWRSLVVLQLLALTVVGAATVARFHVWAAVDEGAHFAYVQELAEHGRLPRIDDVVSPEVQAITDATWPRPSGRDPARIDLVGRSYEAFQPPLYHLLAVPAFDVVRDHRHKVFVVRGFDALLLGLAALLLALLARAHLPEAPEAAYAAGLTVLLWPGVVARAVTISNLPLELVMTAALLLALTRAEQRREPGALIAAGALMSACLLTKLTLVYLLVPFAVVLARSLRAAPRATVAAALLPGLVLAPWLVSNLVRLGTLTANNAARDQQTPLLYPHGNDFGLGDVPSRLAHLTDGVIAQEWSRQLGVWWVGAGVLLLAVPLVAGAIAVAVRRRDVVSNLPGMALLAGLGVAVITAASAHWDLFLLRYFYAPLPALAIAVAAVAYRRFGARPLAAVVVAQSLLLGALWVDMAGAFYFADAGRHLGI